MSLHYPKMSIWEEICSKDNLLLAYQNARRGKTFYAEVKEIDKNPEAYIEELHNILVSGQYRTSKYEIFTRKEGKKERVIYKLPFYPDRICQWAVLQAIEPFFLRTFITTTYSSIPGRGIHNCLKKVKRDIKFYPNELNIVLNQTLKNIILMQTIKY